MSIKSLFGVFILVCLLGSMITLIYAYILWYLQAVGFSLIFYYLVARLYGFLIVKCYGKRFLQSFSEGYKHKLFVIFLVLAHLLIFWYVYWIFWIDLTINQHTWNKVNYSWLPIDYFRITFTDLSNVLYLLFNPDKVVSFLTINIKFGYFKVFDLSIKNEMTYLLWFIEIGLMNWIVYHLIFKDQEQIKEKP